MPPSDRDRFDQEHDRRAQRAAVRAEHERLTRRLLTTQARLDQLTAEAPARAWDWLCRVRDQEAVPPLHRLNPIIAHAVLVRRAMHKGDKPTFFAGDDRGAGDWRAWMRLDGRAWDETQRIPYDQPLDAGHAPGILPVLVAAPESRGMRPLAAGRALDPAVA